MLRIGFDITDSEGRKFYYDDSAMLTSNPPQYRVWYVDNITEQEFVQTKNVFVLKNVPANEVQQLCAQLGIPYTGNLQFKPSQDTVAKPKEVKPIPSEETEMSEFAKSIVFEGYDEDIAEKRAAIREKVKPILDVKYIPQEETKIIVTGTGNDAPGELTPPKKKRGRPKKTLVGKNGFPHVGGKGSYCPSVKKGDNVELPNKVPDISLEPSKFEYMVVNESMDITDEFSNTLNDYGGEGWEMCGFNVYREGLLSSELRVMCIFKRRV